ncbi:MAG: carbohydrate ABC transporter permease [Lachnospiraceae bacterium]|nr:carbohydrate ABC transporter permease [Lachnospiraceae bacterium]
MKRTKIIRITAKIGFVLALMAYLVFSLFPFFVMVSMSFSSKFAIMGSDTPIWPKNPILTNYKRMWEVVPLLKYIKNSIIVCTATVVFSLLMSVPASYALSRFRFRGKKTFSISILATQLFPGITMLLPIYLMYVNFTKLTGIPMTKTLHGLVIAFATFGIPYSIWMLKSYFDSIPDELEQAAMIDGCSRTKAMVKVVLPLVVPGMVATGLYVFLLAWNNILFAGVLTDQATRTFATGLQEFASESSTEYGLLMAACSVTTIPIVALFFAFQKYFVGGMTGGAVKG